ncbi:MAG: LLM class F420-dependent oxidoreductase [Actinomycetota bacterium]|nr:LLM class F420-dependent oxidoreductase [Actinomycetota bacterium]
MRISFKTSPFGTDWPSLRAMWREANGIEAYDGGWTFDHFYPLAGDPSGPCFEGWMLLPALAVEAPRLRLGVMVSSNTYRHPAVLANMAATLDVISGGRLELGLGAGWHEEEHRAYGIDLPALGERFDRLDEACQVLHLLLTKKTATFQGKHYRLREARCEPKPIQQPRPPLVIGGRGENRTLRIAARWADQWNLPGGPPEELRHKIAVLHRHCEELGRDPSHVEVSVQLRAAQDPAETARQGAALAQAGAQHLVVMFPTPFDPGMLAPAAEALQAALA